MQNFLKELQAVNNSIIKDSKTFSSSEEANINNTSKATLPSSKLNRNAQPNLSTDTQEQKPLHSTTIYVNGAPVTTILKKASAAAKAEHMKTHAHKDSLKKLVII